MQTIRLQTIYRQTIVYSLSSTFFEKERCVMANGGSKHPTIPQQETKTAGQTASEQTKSDKK